MKYDLHMTKRGVDGRKRVKENQKKEQTTKEVEIISFPLE
jgi:hypothetical protein